MAERERMNALFAAVMLVAAPTEYEFRFDRGVVTVAKAPCTAPRVVARIKPEFIGQFFAGHLMFDKRPVAFCWAIDPRQPDHIFLIDENGETVSLPGKAFKPKGTQV